MDFSTLPDDVLIEASPKLFLVAIGGQDVWDMLLAHWKGESLRSIASRYDESHVTVANWIRVAKTKMRAAGLNADAVKGYAERHAQDTADVI